MESDELEREIMFYVLGDWEKSDPVNLLSFIDIYHMSDSYKRGLDSIFIPIGENFPKVRNYCIQNKRAPINIFQGVEIEEFRDELLDGRIKGHRILYLAQMRNPVEYRSLNSVSTVLVNYKFNVLVRDPL